MIAVQESEIQISILDASKSYQPDSFALRNVSLEVRKGEFLALVGASGAGKTTLIKLINRLIEPFDGQILVAGKDIRSVDAVRLRRSIGYVFQEVGLFPHLTVAENIAITPHLLRWDAAAVDARIHELLTLVRLPQDIAPRFPASLSGGQRQRVGVARAIAARPEIMLMDEPFGAVDAITRDVLGRDYRYLHDELKLTTIMITHDVGEAILLADRIAVMRDGEILALGTPDALFGHPSNEYVRELMAMPRRQADRVNALIAGSAQ